MGRHNPKKRAAYKKRRNALMKLKPKQDIPCSQLESAKKVIDWMTKNDYSGYSVTSTSSSSTAEDSFRVIENDSLYKSYKKFCQFTAMMNELSKRFSETTN